MRYELIAEKDKNNSVLVQVLANRQIKNIYRYLHTTDDDIYDPLLLDNMDQGAELLLKHIQNGDRIFIQVDSDADGFTSSSILINYLHRLYPDYVENKVKYWVHDNKAHGIDLDNISDDIKLVVAPDSSSEEESKHKVLYDKGIDVLILDHHNASKYSDYAITINNQLCNYPNKDLSGAGIVYKFCTYLDKKLNVNYADDYLDLTILGIIADVMDLRNCETRQLIVKGIENTHNKFLTALLEKQESRTGGELTPKIFAWNIAPYVNAITRIGTIEERRLIFEAMLDFKATELLPSTKRGEKGKTEQRCVQAARTAMNVKRHQDTFRDEFAQDLTKQIEDKHLLDNKILIIQLDENDENTASMRGLVANKFMSRYQRPVMILSKIIDKDGIIHWAGSGRNGGGALESLQAFLKESQLIDYANGHDNALGISIPDDKINDFINYANQKLKDVDFTPKYKVDMIYQQNNIDINDLFSVGAETSLWGQGIEEPLFAFENIEINGNNTQLLGAKNNALKISLSNGLSFIKFGTGCQIEYESLVPTEGKRYLNIVGTCSINAYDGKPQIQIVDYEIAKELKYYF